MKRSLLYLLFLPLAACATVPPAPPPPPSPPPTVPPPPPIEVQILAINDFHGNLEPPKLSIEATAADGSKVRVPAGGVAHLATAARSLREGHPHSMTVSAGDMIGGTPFVSATFLDEPTIRAMELVGVDYNAVGNHEFDKGAAELLRMKSGGCATHTTRQPCRLEPFTGARFDYLAANVLTATGQT
ncbi:MAG TPA: bifunctional metallophosphatase/5'-nucleotidase, partial [Sphingomicrobium sp.]